MTLPYTINEGLSVCHVKDPFVAHTIKSLGILIILMLKSMILRDVAGFRKCIDLVLHDAEYHPRFTSIEKAMSSAKSRTFLNLKILKDFG